MRTRAFFSKCLPICTLALGGILFFALQASAELPSQCLLKALGVLKGNQEPYPSEAIPIPEPPPTTGRYDLEAPLDLAAVLEKNRAKHGRPGKAALSKQVRDRKITELAAKIEELEQIQPKDLKEPPSAAIAVEPLKSPPPRSEVEEALEKIQGIEKAINGPLSDLHENTALTALQKTQVARIYRNIQLAQVEAMSHYFKMIGIPHEIGRDPMRSRSGPVIIFQGGVHSNLGKMIEKIAPKEGSSRAPAIKVNRVVWAPNIDWAGCYNPALKIVYIDLESAIHQTISQPLRHELDHAFEDSSIERNIPRPYQVHAKVIEDDATLPGRENTEEHYGRYLSFQELRTYNRDVTQHLMDISSHLRRTTGPLTRETLLALVKFFISRQHQFSSVVERAARVLAHAIDLIHRGQNGYAFREPNSLVIMDQKSGLEIVIANLQSSQVSEIKKLRLLAEEGGEYDALMALLDSIALARLQETGRVTSDLAVLSEFEDEALDSLSHAKSLGQQTQILGALLAVRRPRPLPGESDYAPLTRDKLIAEYGRAIRR